MTGPTTATLVFGLAPVALAGAFGVIRRPGALAVIRGLALGAALVVILTDLLPAAWAELGLLSLLVAATGYALPALSERLLAHHSGAMVAAVGVGAHQLLHGAEQGALGDRLGAMGLLAMGAHAFPLVGLVLADARDAWGERATRALWLVLLGLTALGLWLGGQLPSGGHGPVQAAVVGLLLHVTTHGAPHREAPRSLWGGVVVGALAAAVVTASG